MKSMGDVMGKGGGVGGHNSLLLSWWVEKSCNSSSAIPSRLKWNEVGDNTRVEERVISNIQPKM